MYVLELLFARRHAHSSNRSAHLWRKFAWGQGRRQHAAEGLEVKDASVAASIIFVVVVQELRQRVVAVVETGARHATWKEEHEEQEKHRSSFSGNTPHLSLH